MIRATLNEPVPLQILTPDERADLYARARLFTPDGALVEEFNLPHMITGLYATTWTPNEEGYYSVVYDLFTDEAYTTPADYDREGELIEVTSEKVYLLRLLGLAHENSVLDQHVYNANGRLVSARLRNYDTKANAQAAGETGLRFTWTVTATYNAAHQLTSYRIVSES